VLCSLRANRDLVAVADVTIVCNSNTFGGSISMQKSSHRRSRVHVDAVAASVFAESNDVPDDSVDLASHAVPKRKHHLTCVVDKHRVSSKQVLRPLNEPMIKRLRSAFLLSGDVAGFVCDRHRQQAYVHEQSGHQLTFQMVSWGLPILSVWSVSQL